jgi:hypothetical protein
MIFHACKADGASIGQFEEADFREKISRGELLPGHYYWCEGMADWKPISEYKPPGKVTTILGSIPTRETRRAALSKARISPLNRLKNFFGADRKT